MNNFDWRWIGAIGLIVLLLQIRFLPPIISTLLLAGGGAYFLWIGWKSWTGGGSGRGKKVTYWRGQRIEVAPQRRSFVAPRGSTLWRSVIFLLIGGVLVLAAGSQLLAYAQFLG